MTLLQRSAFPVDASTTFATEATGGGCEAVTLRIYGRPAPQGSKRSLGNGIMIESSKRARPWRNDVKIESREQYRGPVLTGPVSVSITFWLPRPKSHYRTGRFAGQLKPNAPTHSTSCADGDLDKLLRCTLDGLSAKCGGWIIGDDSLVVQLNGEKRYVTATEGCGATIRVIQR